ncbi:MAG TPA: SDR family NAD(P)-dependent oxidoreductase [Cyclobacteriaceae bacterium]|nr:SDR family NAD(P)-dependent oxidoreductase [Cyclobacteriaceae bacterium]
MKKLIVVSGGTKGIGRAVIEKFASEGFDVFTCARNKKDLTLLKKTIEGDHGVSLYYSVADLSERSSQAMFAEDILALDRPVEVLVNNAGYFEPGLITEEREGALEKMMDTNVFSAYHLTRALVKKMKSAQAGHIFSICSVASLFAYPNGGSYSISKFALLGFSKVLREELKQFGIRVTAVIAGATYTASWESSSLSPERFMKPQDVADAVFGAYSLSPQSVIEELIIRPQLGDI